MGLAGRDANNVPTLLGVSSSDGVTPIALYADPTTHRLLTSASGGAAPSDATFVTLSTNATLTNERVLTGTSNQVTITDNGAGSTVVLSLPQSIATSSTPTFASMTLSAASSLTLGTASSATGAIILKNSTNANNTTIQAGAAGAALVFTLPTTDGNASDFLQTDGNGVLSWAAGASGANTALSNLASVALNTALLPDAAAADDFGSATLPFKDLWIAGSSGTPGTNNFQLTGASTSGTRVITFPDATGTLLYSGGPLGTPASGTLTNCTIPVGGISGLGANIATFLATPSSANLLAAVTDETGTGALVFANTPTLVTPALGVATATSINKVAITAPATSATLTISDGKTLTATQSITLTGTDSTVMTFPTTSATIARTDAGQTFTGVSNATSWNFTTPVLGTPTSGTLTNCTGLPAASIVPGTLVAGTYLLAENASIGLDPAGSADGKYSGITVTATAGYTQAFGDLVYLDPTDSRWEACDANAASGADGDCRGTMGMVVVAGTDGAACTILLQGIIRADAKFPAMTINAPMYASETAAAITGTAPTTSGAVVRPVGAALTADELYFNPPMYYQTAT